MINIDYSQMSFYAAGTFSFTFILAYFFYIIYQAPIEAALKIKKEQREVLNGEKVLLFEFKFLNLYKSK